MRSTHALLCGSHPFTYDGQCRPPLPSHAWLAFRPASGASAPAPSRSSSQPAAERGAPGASAALKSCVAPDPAAWPARTIHHRSPRRTTLESSTSAPLAGGLWGSKSFVSLPVRRCSVPAIAPLNCADPFYLGLLDRPRFNGRWRCGSLGGISWVHRRPVREVDEHLERARTTQCSSDRKSGLLLTKLHNFRCSL